MTVNDPKWPWLWMTNIFFDSYPPVIKGSNGKSHIMKSFYGNIIYKWGIFHDHVWLPEDTSVVPSICPSPCGRGGLRSLIWMVPNGMALRKAWGAQHIQPPFAETCAKLRMKKGWRYDNTIVFFTSSLWWSNIAMERSTMFNGKIHYFYGHFQ